MELTQYEADTLLMAIRFQQANDHEIVDVEWHDLNAIKEKLEAYVIFQQIINSKEYGYIVEGGALICPACATNPLYNLSLETAYQEGYPEGYSCAECGVVVNG
jgi:hypothetical protein